MPGEIWYIARWYRTDQSQSSSDFLTAPDSRIPSFAVSHFSELLNCNIVQILLHHDVPAHPQQELRDGVGGPAAVPALVLRTCS